MLALKFHVSHLAMSKTHEIVSYVFQISMASMERYSAWDAEPLRMIDLDDQLSAFKHKRTASFGDGTF